MVRTDDNTCTAYTTTSYTSTTSYSEVYYKEDYSNNKEVEYDDSRDGWNNPKVIGKPKQKIGKPIKRTIRSTLYGS